MNFLKKLHDLPLVNFGEKCKILFFLGGGGGVGNYKTNPLWILEKTTRLTPCEFWEKYKTYHLWIFGEKIQDLTFVNFEEKTARFSFWGGVGNYKTNPLWILGKNTRLTPCEFWGKNCKIFFLRGVGNYKANPLWFLGKKLQDLPVVNFWNKIQHLPLVIFGKKIQHLPLVNFW